MAIMAPSGGPLKTASYLGEMGVSAFFALARDKYCHNGAWPSPATRAPLAAKGCPPEGFAIAIVVSVVGRKKVPIFRGKAKRSMIRALWGQRWTRLPGPIPALRHGREDPPRRGPLSRP
jgi:hypothetical protein